MKFLLGLIATIAISFLVQYFNIGPWWSISVIAFVVAALVRLNGFKSFLFGFLAIALLWGAYAFFINGQNEGILSTKIGMLLGGLSSNSLVIISALIGAIVGGLGAMTGSLAQQLIKK